MTGSRDGDADAIAIDLDAREKLLKARFALADLDGTLMLGNKAILGAREIVREFGDRLAVVSNYSTMTRQQMAARLDGMGLKIDAERIFLAGEASVREVARQHPGARVICLLVESLCQMAVDLGLKPVSSDAEVLLVGRDLNLSYERLAGAMRAIHEGAAVFATNLDRSHPGAGFVPVPETGSLMLAITGARPETEIQIVGKPTRTMFDAALAVLNAAPQDAIMLGDNPDTDAAGASMLGMDTILVAPERRAGRSLLHEILPDQWK